MSNYIRYNSSTSVNRSPEDPHCFGLQWEADDPDCRYNCEEFYRCGREFRRVSSIADEKSRIALTKSRQGSKGNGSTSMVRRDAGRGGLIRPKLSLELPPGTEYLPPGKHGPVKRGIAMAFAEGIGAGGGTFFDSLGDFMRDIPAWHRYAGRRTYGERWDDQRDDQRGSHQEEESEEPEK